MHPVLALLAGLVAGAGLYHVLARDAAADCLQELAFVDATVHAGSIDYFFAVPDVGELRIRIENDTAAAGAFDGLILPGVDEPAGANPERLGELFDICRVPGGPELRAER